MDFYHYTYLSANGYLNKFRAALAMPDLTLQHLHALLKTFNTKYKLRGFIALDDAKKNPVYYKNTLDSILGNKLYLRYLTDIDEEWTMKAIEKERKEREMPKTWDDINADVNMDDTDMNKVSDKLIYNDNYGELAEMKKGKNIYITESQLEMLLNEAYVVEPNKVKVVKKYLDDNFIKGGMPTLGEDGMPKTMAIVAVKGSDGNPLKNMSDSQLFYMIQSKFPKLHSDGKKRDKLIKQILKDWYYDKISPEGILSVNLL